MTEDKLELSFSKQIPLLTTGRMSIKHTLSSETIYLKHQYYSLQLLVLDVLFKQ